MMNRLKELIGKTLTSVERVVYEGSEELIFTTTEGKKYKMYHVQVCCESVEIDDINGDLQDLVGSPITLAEESSNGDLTQDEIKKTEKVEEYGSCTWTFYRFATLKGYVNIKWFGESNGYYSESVDVILIGEDYEY